MSAPTDVRARRVLAAGVLSRFKVGEISNDEFESQFDELMAGDRVIFQMWKIIWQTYSDLYEHKLTANHALGPGASELFGRCILFLRSGCEYQWPIRATLPERIRSFLQGEPPGRRDDAREGDRDAWPFFTMDDYENAKQDSLGQ